MPTVPLDALREVLTVLFQTHQQVGAGSTTYLTVPQLGEAAQQLGLPLPDPLQPVLNQGVRQGAFLKCVTAATANTGHKEFQYAYNPSMLSVNGANRALLLTNGCVNCVNSHLITGYYVTQSNARFPVAGYSGEIVGLGSGCCNQCTSPPVLSASGLASLQRCCGGSQ